MNGLRAVAIVGILLGTVSCQPSPVKHVVICWLKEPGKESARQQLIDESRSFRKIPGIVQVSAGRALPTTGPAVYSTFDVAVAMSFKDEHALKAYATHPVHQAAVERTLKPLVARYVVYDFRDD